MSTTTPHNAHNHTGDGRPPMPLDGSVMRRRRHRRRHHGLLLPLVVLLVLGSPAAVVDAFWRPAAIPDAVRPTALLTGGNRGTHVHVYARLPLLPADPQSSRWTDDAMHTHAGLGKATAELLVDVGYHVILTARNEAEVSEGVSRLARPALCCVTCDV